MPRGRPKGTSYTRCLILQAFYDKYWDTISRFRKRWPQFWQRGVRSNPEYWHDYMACLILPSLNFNEIRKATKLSPGTVSRRLRELVAEKSIARRTGKQRGYTLIRSMEWHSNECQPAVHIGLRRGRPRKMLSPEDELRLMSKLQRLPQSEINFLKSNGLSLRLGPSGSVVAYFHARGTGMDPSVAKVLGQIRTEQKAQRFAKTWKKRAGLK